jgi:hypothetical protein
MVQVENGTSAIVRSYEMSIVQKTLVARIKNRDPHWSWEIADRQLRTNLALQRVATSFLQIADRHERG